MLNDAAEVINYLIIYIGCQGIIKYAIEHEMKPTQASITQRIGIIWEIYITMQNTAVKQRFHV